MAVKRTRRRYDDKFRASAVVMLEAEGYPDKKGALEKVSKHLGVAKSTLHGWARAEQNPPPSELRTEKRGDLAALIEDEIHNVLSAMPGAIPDASYRDLATGLGILVDKKQLLDGKATEIIDDLRTNEERANRINQLFDTARDRRDRPAVQ